MPKVLVRVPGVYTLLGIFSDYCKGHCITGTGEQALQIAVSIRDDQMVRLYNATLNDRKRFSLGNIKFRKEDRWGNFIKGVIAELVSDGVVLPGLNVTVGGELLHCDNITVSGALALGTVMALDELMSLSLDQAAMLRISYLANTSFNNETCRIADLLTMLNGKEGKLMLFDLQHVSYSYFDYPFHEKNSPLGIIVESRIPPHAMREEMMHRRLATKDAFARLRQQCPSGPIRDFPENELKERTVPLDEDSRHICSYVLAESRLATEGSVQLAQKDAVLYGKTISRMQAGLRDLMEITCPEVDWLTKRASEIPGCLGAGLVSNGLSGTIMILLDETVLPVYLDRLEEYEHIFGFHPRWMIYQPQGCAKVMPVICDADSIDER
ncbi:MAG: galactokinase [Sphaerochaetaceae bacterium]|nr:galactokinase [Sphaerochaetaceae bacterium]